MTLSKPQAVSSPPSHATAHPPRPASACVHASTLCRKPAASRGLACSRTATSATRTGEAKDTVSWYVSWSRRAGAHEPAFSVAQSPSLCEGGPTASSSAQSPPYSDVAYASAAYCVTSRSHGPGGLPGSGGGGSGGGGGRGGGGGGVEDAHSRQPAPRNKVDEASLPQLEGSTT